MAATTAKKPTSRTTKATTVDDYLAAAPKDKRVVLGKIRKTIKATAPSATEGMAYGLAGYKYRGRPLIYFGYWSTHCSLYGVGNAVIDAHAKELSSYDRTKGTIKFSAAAPPPEPLVRKLVKWRMAAIEKGAG